MQCTAGDHKADGAHPFQTIVLARLTAAAKVSQVFGPTSMPYTTPATQSTHSGHDSRQNETATEGKYQHSNKHLAKPAKSFGIIRIFLLIFTSLSGHRVGEKNSPSFPEP